MKIQYFFYVLKSILPRKPVGENLPLPADRHTAGAVFFEFILLKQQTLLIAFKED